jgi:hypothetical protein
VTQYTHDGGVIPDGVPVSERRDGDNEHRTKFGVYKGLVLETIYPEDDRNTSGERIEYKVKIKGQNYFGAVDMRKSGGVFDFSERTRKKIEKSITGKVEEATFDENLDGEIVYIVFLEGNGELPIIIGAAEHPQRKSEKTAADGTFESEAFNGVEVSIDKDSNYKIEQVGRKNPDGVDQNTPAVGSSITMNGVNGSIEMQTSQGNLFVVDNTAGQESISIIQKQGAVIQMDKDGSVKIIAKGGAYLFLDATTGEASLTSKEGITLGATADGMTLASKSGKETILLKDDTVQITSGKTVVVSAEKVTIDSGDIDIGSDADNAVLYSKLEALFDAHTHISPVGPTSPPLPLQTLTLTSLIPFKSAKAGNVKLKGNL